MAKRSLQIVFFVLSLAVGSPVMAFGGAGGFAEGLNRGIQQGMQLRLQQQQLEMMERAEKREEERHKAYLQQQQGSEQSRRAEIERDLSEFIGRNPEYKNKERLQELQGELQRLRNIPDNRNRNFAWFLEEGHKALSVKDQVTTAKNSNPTLVHWEINDQAAWQEALRQDEALRTAPAWSDKPYEERFAEVVRRVMAIMPDASKPPVN